MALGYLADPEALPDTVCSPGARSQGQILWEGGHPAPGAISLSELPSGGFLPSKIKARRWIEDTLPAF